MSLDQRYPQDFQILIVDNEATGKKALVLEVSNLSQLEAENLGTHIAAWLTEMGGWNARVQ